MTTVRDELSRIQSDTEALVSLAESNSNVSAELVNELGDFRNDVNAALADISVTTETMVANLHQQLASFEDRVAKVITASALLIHKGQKEQAQEIAGSILTGSVVGGLFSMLGGAIAGRLISDSITESAANRPPTPDEFKAKALALLLARMEAERTYVSLDEITQRASSEKEGILSGEETRRLVLVLQADGVLEQSVNSTAFRLSRQNPLAIEFLNAYSANKTTSSVLVSSTRDSEGKSRSDFLDLGPSFGLTLSYQKACQIESISISKVSQGKYKVLLWFGSDGRMINSKLLKEDEAEQLRVDTQNKLADFLCATQQ